jgi:hypothetical protein
MSQFIRRWPPDTPVLNILRRSDYFDEPPRNVRSINTATNAVRCASSCTPCCIVDPDIARNQNYDDHYERRGLQGGSRERGLFQRKNHPCSGG